LDLFDFINLASPSHMDDKTYNKIISNWNEFIDCLPSEEDKQLLLELISKSCFKQQKSIKAYGLSHFELSNGLLLPILIYQQIQSDSIKQE
jgi:hypothetical protein